MNTCTAGKWDDNSSNWSRAFDGQKQPSFVIVHHSRVWRSPHFTYEGEYFFELSVPDEFLNEWISGQKLSPIKPTEANTPLFYDKPAWFLAKSLENYEMWLPAYEEHSNFRIYRDKATRRVFVADSQG